MFKSRKKDEQSNIKWIKYFFFMNIEQGNLPKFGMFPNICIFALFNYLKVLVHNL